MTTLRITVEVCAERLRAWKALTPMQQGISELVRTVHQPKHLRTVPTPCMWIACPSCKAAPRAFCTPESAS